MNKTILITGATDGIGLATAKMLLPMGHHVLLHGRNLSKLEQVAQELRGMAAGRAPECFRADLSRMDEVEALAKAVMEKHQHLDVLINNAGVYQTSTPETAAGLDIRFVVNTFAPYILTQRLRPLLGTSGRVVNLSSAAQSTVDLEAMAGRGRLSSGAAYAQSKLALTMWTRQLAHSLGSQGPIMVAVNPGSLLASKMVKQAFGVPGSDITIGAKVLCRAALSEDFATASGKYFDNDKAAFADPHPDGLDPKKCQQILDAMERILG